MVGVKNFADLIKYGITKGHQKLWISLNIFSAWCMPKYYAQYTTAATVARPYYSHLTYSHPCY